MHAAKIAKGKGVAAFRFFRHSVGQAQMPCRVVVPRMGVEERVLLRGARLSLAPFTFDYVLAVAYELFGSSTADIVMSKRPCRLTYPQWRRYTRATTPDKKMEGEAGEFPLHR